MKLIGLLGAGFLLFFQLLVSASNSNAAVTATTTTGSYAAHTAHAVTGHKLPFKNNIGPPNMGLGVPSTASNPDKTVDQLLLMQQHQQQFFQFQDSSSDGQYASDFAFKVSVRRDSLASARSCQHTFSQIELLNLHATEHIWIHSIRTGTEETVLMNAAQVEVNAAAATTYNEREENQESITNNEHPVHVDLKQQLHASRLPASSLTLGPGQVAIVPITFLPHFPVLDENEVSSSPSLSSSPRMTTSTEKGANSNTRASASSSIWQQADLEDWLGVTVNYYGSAGRRSSSASASGTGLPPRSNQWITNDNDSKDDDNDNGMPLQTFQNYQVSAVLQVDTSRGIVQLPITATSIRGNDYGLPDIVYFEPTASTSGGGASSATDKDSTTAPDHRPAEQPNDDSTSTGTSGSPAPGATVRGDVTDPTIWVLDSDHRRNDETASDKKNDKTEAPSSSSDNNDNNVLLDQQHQDCYDLYLKHPGQVRNNGKYNNYKDQEKYEEQGRNIEITEVLLSRIEHLSLQVFPEKLTTNLDKNRSTNDNDDEARPAPTKPSQVVRKWTDRGPLLIPADGRQHYLVTICTNTIGSTGRSEPDIERDDAVDLYLEEIAHWIDEGNDAYTLGFLQIRTDSDTMFVSLERQRARMNVNKRATNADANANADAPPMTDFWQQQQQQQEQQESSPAPVQLSVEYEEDESSSSSSSQVPVTEIIDIQAVPEFVDFYLLTSASPTAKASIGIRNNLMKSTSTSDNTVTLMRGSAVMRLKDPELELAKQIGLKVKFRFASNDDDKENGGFVSIAPGATLEEALLLECSVDWDKLTESLLEDSITFSGSVIVRATSGKRTYLEWMEEQKANLSADSNLVLEIPYSINVVNGKIGVMVQGATHPFPLFWSLEEPNQEIQAVSSAFFPRTAYDIGAMMDLSDYDFSFEMKGMDHYLRAFSNVATQMKLNSAVVVESSEMKDKGEVKSLCDRFDVSLRGDGSTPTNFESPSHTDLGLVHLRYRFPQSSRETEPNITSEIYPTTCFLRLTTEPSTGVHLTPLVIYPGQVDVSASMFQSDPSVGTPTSLKAEVDNAVWHRAIVGFDNLVTWLQETNAGRALRSVLDSSMDNRKGPERDLHLLGRYLYSLARQSMELENAKLRPVLLKVGAIAQSEMETLPLYLTNHNPVPISIRIDVGEVEGMSISLGRDPSIGRGDGNSLLDYLPRKAGSTFVAEPRIQSGPLKGHPVNGIRQFLVSDGVAGSFLTQFPYRDAVSLSEAAVAKQPLLRRLYRTYAVGGFHRAPHPLRFAPDAWSHCEQSEHPPLYGSFDKKLPARRMPGPIIVSSDGETVRRLPVCWDRDSEPADSPSDGSSVVLPPGGVARFDINLRAPPSSVLAHDITEFVATGLVLSTDHGEVMPILIAFDALKGKLEVSHVPVPLVEEPSGAMDYPPSKAIRRDGVIRVPVGLFVEPSTARDAALKIPPRTSQSLANLAHAEIVPRNASLVGESGVSLFMKSSFSRDVRLREVSSCNPWFEVVLNDEQSDFEPDPFLGVNIGAVSSIVSCRDTYGGLPNPSAFPSFFRCTLNWLAKRAELQPLGCGLLPAMEKGNVETEGNQVAERGGVERATRAFERALLVSEWVYKGLPESPDPVGPGPFKSGRKRSWDGVVAAPIVDVIADAWDSWRVASEFGMRVLSTSLRATIEYNSTRDEKSQVGFSSSNASDGHLLSVALRNLTIEAVLATPKLLDIERAKNKMMFGTALDDGSPSVIEFSPTLVAAVSSLTIPLRNPTAVPVRVRLAVAPPKAEKRDKDSIVLNELGVDESIRDHFLGKLGAPYVQNGMRSADTPVETARSLWWDGEGAYFLADSHGDLILSRYNMTIKAGTGAHVSLVNPSLLSNTAFLTGCGSRCAVRNDAPKKVHGMLQVDLRLSSPIGASAAGGVTLVGHKRSNLPPTNQVASEGLYVAAGGSLLTDGVGPAAFAIPFGALDEIIIPPFGEAELGPILFRPPGRSQFIGCEAAAGANAPEGCDSRSFESMIFLENSLTGLERVVIRGRTQWESVVFLDPPSKDGVDEFGDIELRNGHYTLAFPGTAEMSSWGARSSLSPQSVVKEVVVHNNGDVPVAFATMFLSDTAKLHEKRTRNRRGRVCSQGDFHLLDCFANGDSMPSFELLPGQNRSLFIEHQPKCSKKKEFVALNLEYRRNEPAAVHDAPTRSGGMASVSGVYVSPSQTTVRKQAKASEWKKTFRGRKIDLLVGYEMTDEEFASCVSAPRGTNHHFFEGGNEYEVHSNSLRNHSIPFSDSRKGFRAGRANKLADMAYSTISIISAILALSASAAALAQRYFCRQEASHRFQCMLQSPQTRSEDSTGSHNLDDGTNWSAAFRCLARGDPASPDLQTLGREQIRQVVLARYRSMGVLPPQCFSSAGIFHRERAGVSNNQGRQIPSKEGTPGSNERIRTLSDAIFRNLTVKDLGTGNIPCELGWRTAVARGIITSSSLKASPVVLRTESLLLHRSKHSPAPEDDEDSDQSISLDDEGEGESFTLNASSGEFDESDVESLDDDKKAELQMDIVVDDSPPISEEIDIPVDKDPIATDKDPIATVKDSKKNKERDDIKIQNGGRSSRVEETDIRTANTKSIQNGGRSSTVKETNIKTAITKSNEKNVSVKQTKIESNTGVAQQSIALDDRKPQRAETTPAKQPDEEPAADQLLNDTSSGPKKQNGRQEKTRTTTPKSNRRKPKIKFQESADEKQIDQDQDQEETKKESKKKTPKAERGRKVKPMESSNTRRALPRKTSSSSPKKAERESERKTAVISPADQPGPPIFRPPPGLAPPPGFGGSPTSQPVKSSPGGTIVPLSPPGALGVQRKTTNPSLTGGDYLARPSIVSRSLTGDSYLSVSSSVAGDHLLLSNAASPIVPFRIVSASHAAGSSPGLSDEAIAPPQLEQTTSMAGFDVMDTGFDVMDFLDGILNDTLPADEDGANSDPGGLLVEAQPVGQNSTVLPFSANPWAALDEGHQSRAAAYGISFEDEIGRTADQTNLNLPLLTPAAILAATSLARDQDEPDTRGSFYATLLEE